MDLESEASVRSKVDGFVPCAQHVNLGIVREPERAVTVSLLSAMDPSPSAPLFVA